jgi:cysteine-rich repeat protein
VLSWEVAGATKVRILEGDREIHVAAGPALMAGSFVVAVTKATTMYTLVASNDSSMQMQSLTVTGELPPEIRSFKVTPTLWTGTSQMVSVSWTTRNASQVTLTANGMPAPGFMNDVPTGTVSIMIMQTTLFELRAHSGAGNDIADIASASYGTEMEPNDDYMHANPLPTGAIAGAIMPSTDLDYFSFAVPEGGHVFAQTMPQMMGAPCYDTQITLWAKNGTTALGSNDDGPNPPCSQIDPSISDDFAKDLPGGTYFISVQHSPMAMTATLTGTYALVVLTAPPRCGNGILEKNEDCDLGPDNSANGNCTTDCKFNFAGSISPPMGVVNTTLLMMDDLRLIKVNITHPGEDIEVSTKGPDGHCTVSTALQLYDPTQAPLGSTRDDGMGGNCAAIRFPQDDFATNLAPGAYFLVVSNAGMTGGMVTVTVTIHEPMCGNGAVETLSGEQCDDGNTTSGDGCSSTCKIEPKGMVSGPGAGPTMPATQSFSSAIVPAGKKDYFQINMSAPGYIVGETGSPMVGTCATGVDTVLDLLDGNFLILGSNDDINYPTDKCSRITYDPGNPYAKVMQGTYYLRVHAFSATVAISAYQLGIKLIAVGCGNGILEMGEQCDDGNTMSGDGCSATCQLEVTPTPEVEPNNDIMHATPTGATKGHLVIMQGSITPMDTDFYSFTVPAGMTATLISRTHTTLTDPNSCVMPTDTKLTLYNASMTQLAQNDDINTGVNNCSLIDGTGADTGAANLPAGTYYLQVDQFDPMGMTPVYFLDVRLY